MSRNLKTAVAIVLILALGFPAYAGYELWSTSSKIGEARQELKSSHSNSQGWKDTQNAAQDELDATTERARTLSETVKARQNFDTSLEAVKEQLQLAAGSIPIEDAQRRIIAAQNQILKEDADSKIIEAQTAELDAVTAELKDRRGVPADRFSTDPILSQAVEAAVNAVGEAIS